jgi:hypothetical protein
MRDIKRGQFVAHGQPGLPGADHEHIHVLCQ